MGVFKSRAKAKVKISNFLKNFLILLLKFYKKFISPHLGENCRFYPTCSEYAMISIERFGMIKGVYLSLKRLLRCHPFCKGGIDYPPSD